MGKDFWSALTAREPYVRRVKRLFERGVISSVSEDVVDVCVGCREDGSEILLEAVPVVSGYNPAVGDWVVIRYDAGHGGAPMVFGPSVSDGSEAEPSTSSAEVVAARSSARYGSHASLDARLEEHEQDGVDPHGSWLTQSAGLVSPLVQSPAAALLTIGALAGLTAQSAGAMLFDAEGSFTAESALAMLLQTAAGYDLTLMSGKDLDLDSRTRGQSIHLNHAQGCLAQVEGAISGATLSSTKACGSEANVTGMGSRAWSFAGTAFNSDNAHVIFGAMGAETSNWLRVTNFGFDIPSDAVIAGIKVSVERSASNPNTVSDAGVKLCRNDGGAGGGAPIAVGNDRPAAGSWPTTDEVKDYGAEGDLWGLTDWTPAMINHHDFGAQIAATSTGAGNNGLVDYISITVYYAVYTGGTKFVVKRTANQQYTATNPWQVTDESGSPFVRVGPDLNFGFGNGSHWLNFLAAPGADYTLVWPTGLPAVGTTKIFQVDEHGVINFVEAPAAGAPADAPYLTNGAVAGLSGEVNIQALAAGLSFISDNTGIVPITIKGKSGQTADLMNVLDSNDNVLQKIDSAGTPSYYFAADSIYSMGITSYKGRGSLSAITPILSGDRIYGLTGRGCKANGTWSGTQAGMYFFANENWNSTNNGTSIQFWVTPNGSTSVAAKMTLTSALLSLASGVTAQFGTYAAKGAEVFAGYITINDAAGNTRKVMVCA